MSRPPTLRPRCTAARSARTSARCSTARRRRSAACRPSSGFTEALDVATDRPSAEEALRAFVTEHARAAEVTFDETPAPADGTSPGQSCEGHPPGADRGNAPGCRDRSCARRGHRAHPGRDDHARAADGSTSPASITVRLPPGEPVSNPLRRLLVVAARVLASRIEQIRALSSARGRETEGAGALALGSAHAFLGSSTAADHVSRIIPRLAASDVGALLLGETGSGKTFVARLIHEAGPRASEPLACVNCAAIPEHAPRERALRSRARRVHRRGRVARRRVRGGGQRARSSSTRSASSRSRARPSSFASLEERTLRARRLEPDDRAARARHRGDESRSRSDGARRARFRRDLLLPPLRRLARRPAAARARRRHRACSRSSVLARLSARCAGRRVAGFSPARSTRSAATRGRATCASSATRSSAPLVLGDGDVIEPTDLPDVLRGAPATHDIDEGAHGSLALPADLESIEARAIQAALKAAEETARVPPRSSASTASRSTRSSAKSRPRSKSLVRSSGCSRADRSRSLLPRLASR